MNYYTSSEVAEKWNISQRRVQVLCSDGRIKGAVLKCNRWFIPTTAEKPEGKIGRPSKASVKSPIMECLYE